MPTGNSANWLMILLFMAKPTPSVIDWLSFPEEGVSTAIFFELPFFEKMCFAQGSYVNVIYCEFSGDDVSPAFGTVALWVVHQGS